MASQRKTHVSFYERDRRRRRRFAGVWRQITAMPAGGGSRDEDDAATRAKEDGASKAGISIILLASGRFSITRAGIFPRKLNFIRTRREFPRDD